MKKLFTTLAILITLPVSIHSQWIQLTSPSTNSLYCTYFINAATGYLSGSTSGSVIKTTDGGTSWVFQGTGTASSFYDLLFLDALNGFVGGSSKQVLKTTNAGVNWSIETSGSGTVNAISFPTVAIGYAVGGYPATLDKSVDGGNNWTSLTPPTSNPIRGVSFVSGLVGWLCGYYGTMWKTTDGCISWIPETQSSSISFEKITFSNASTGYVVGSSGTILKTTNAGTNWLLQSSGVTAGLYDLFFVNVTTGWAIGSSGKIVKTTDGGNTWLTQGSPSIATFNAIHMVDANTGYIVGSGGILLKTTNGGGVPTPPIFQKITSGVIVSDPNSSQRCAWGDYDGDGYQDLVVTSFNDNNPSSTYPILLYHNAGNGTFTKITTGPIASYVGRTFGAAWGDYDNDGKLDLFVCVGNNQNNLLFHNEGSGNFTQVMSGQIVNDGGWSESCAWCDYDRDGWLDLFVGNQSFQNNFLYHNNGNGTFTKITTGAIVNDQPAWSRGCAWGDYDNDGWPDLFVVNYQGLNDCLYHNNGNGTFTKILNGPEVNDAAWGSGCFWGDYDNDGRLDLFVTNNSTYNMLYHNDGNGIFTRIYTGPGADSGPYCYGGTWFDYDNDGWLDLFVNNGSGFNFLYHNNGNGNFTKITSEVVNSESSVESASADYDNNGKLDLFTTKTGSYAVNSLFKNIGAPGNYLICKLHGCAPIPGNSNKAGIGARVQIKAGSYVAYRVVSGGNGMGSQDMLWQHFGLGTRASVDSVIVYWPSGKIQRFANVTANQVLYVDECLVRVASNNEQTPKDFALIQNYPNPFNPVTKISYELPRSSHVVLKIYDNIGNEISTLVDEQAPPGKYEVDFRGENLSSGIYYYKIFAGDFTATKKMVLIK